MEQQAKQRLTGGIILVALLVLLVPELLSGPSATQPQSQSAPDQAPLRSYTVDLNDGSQHGSAPVAASTQSLEPVPTPAQAGVSASGDPQPEAVPAAQSAPLASAPVDSEPAPPVPAPQASRPHKPQASIAGPKALAHAGRAEPEPATPAHAKPARAESSLAHPHEGKAAATSAARNQGEAKGEWTVQVGLFSSRDNAQRLATSLGHKGFAVKVAEIGPEGRKRYRVRVGSAQNRVGAQRLLARLKAAGQQDGAIVPP